MDKEQITGGPLSIADRPTPSRADSYSATGRYLIETYQLAISVDLWRLELGEMFQFVEKWCEARRENVTACAALPAKSKIRLLFLTPSEHFDFDLAEDLAILNRELVNTFNIGLVEVNQISPGEVDRFLPTEEAQIIYGEIRSSPGPVAAQSRPALSPSANAP